MHVYRNGIRIAVSTCSTGKPGHATPTGVFTILQKDRDHHSSTYNNAPMPNMNRLTWSGIALHAGNLPGYPASHGCVRLPLEFSGSCSRVTHVGTPVIIAGNHIDPSTIVHPGLVLSDAAKHVFDREVAKLNARSHPKDWPADAASAPAVVSVVVTGADRRATVIENGQVVAQGDVTIIEPSRPLGSHVYVLRGPDGDAAHLGWDVMVHTADPRTQLVELGALARIRTAAGVNTAIHDRWHAGMMLVLNDLSSHPDTRTARDFVVMAEDGPA